jgi:hypothetical protein
MKLVLTAGEMSVAQNTVVECAAGKIRIFGSIISIQQ